MKKFWKVQTIIRKRGQNYKTTTITHNGVVYLTKKEAEEELEKIKKEFKISLFKKIFYDIKQVITMEEIKELTDY